MNVLVAYASKYGATAEIAQKLGEVLRNAGLEVGVFPADQVRDVKPYDAVVLGSAVYAGSWMKPVVELLQTQEQDLATRSVWLFSSGPTGEGDPVEIMHGWRYPEALEPLLQRIHPRSIAFFHGKIDLEKMHWGEKLIVKALRAKTGDFRDWKAIQAWARDIVLALRSELVA